jgi:hypothetical protein
MVSGLSSDANDNYFRLTDGNSKLGADSENSK